MGNISLFEVIIKVTIILIYSAFSIIRINFQLKTQKAGLKTVIQESKKYSILLSLLICYEVITLFIYLLAPNLLLWATLPLPWWLRLIGIFIAVAALIFFIWIHKHLGPYFSPELRITDKHMLITTGPYTVIRHPMYTAFYLLHIAAFLMTANWFIGVSWLCGLTVVIILRINREEKMMLDTFGNQYLEYMHRTGKFIPQLRIKNYIKNLYH